MNIRAVDLFSGIGGFRKACSGIRGIDFVGWSELDPKCNALYQCLHPDAKSEFFREDVCDFASACRKGIAPDFDFLFGGFPCQPFSNVGKRQGVEDPRGTLIFNIVECLSSSKPTYFLLENVQKIATIDEGALLSSFISELESAGYHVCMLDLTASDYCLPQQRRRLFFCGFSKKVFDARPEVTIAPIDRNKWKYPTTWHLLEKEMPSVHEIPTKTRMTVLKKNPKWCGDIKINRPIARPITATMGKWHRANQDNYFSESYVLGEEPDWHEPQDRYGKAESVRRLSPLETLRVQGFDNSTWRAMESLGYRPTVAYRLSGNAVPPPLARLVIKSMLKEQK